MGDYHTIVADPPWVLGSGHMGPGGRRRNGTSVPYRFMPTEDIEALPVNDLAADDALLFLWCTRKVFREGVGVRVARAWGFEPFGEIIWGLRNPGAGSRTVANDHEPVLIARKGSPSIRWNGGPLGVYFWRQVYEYGPSGVPQKKHSAKPPGFLELVEQVSWRPYCELFAREARLGWDSWGDEALEHVEMGGDRCAHAEANYGAHDFGRFGEDDKCGFCGTPRVSQLVSGTAVGPATQTPKTAGTEETA